ncbi:unnamed protein product [Bursaphelenchus xylophilus]|nr:unnamed protein product [Bursaphelenchus xylophilus]CAG9101777.1 unnamed protein product [Bursaphelenchus xylophilus]
MYTMSPTKVSTVGEKSETAFYIEGDEVCNFVSGGATYKHPIWDYETDHLAVTDRTNNLCMYTVESRRCELNDQYKIVWLLPRARVQGSRWLFSPWKVLFEIKKVERKLYTSGGVTLVFDIINNTVCVKSLDSVHQIMLDATLYSSIVIRASKKDDPLISDVERILLSQYPDKGRKQATLDAALLIDALSKLPKPTVTTSSMGPTSHFQSLGPLATEDGEERGQRVTEPLIDAPSVIPKNSYNNDVAMVQSRITNVRNEKTIPPEFYKYKGEFMQLLVPADVCHSVVPFDLDEVERRQDKPLQRARSAQVKSTASLNASNKNKSFIKTEPYAGTNAPRPITTMSAEHTMVLSTITLAFCDQVMKRVPWYMPGKSTREVASRIKEHSDKPFITSDYSRFDGHCSKDLAQLAKACIGRALQTKDRTTFSNLFEKTYCKKAVTSNGYVYLALDGTRSGSPTTSVGNTIIDAFIAFVALRELGVPSKKAFNSITIVCGDDALLQSIAGLLPMYELVATKLGMSLEAREIPYGEPVPFAGRYFVDPSLSTTAMAQ